MPRPKWWRASSRSCRLCRVDWKLTIRHVCSPSDVTEQPRLTLTVLATPQESRGPRARASQRCATKHMSWNSNFDVTALRCPANPTILSLRSLLGSVTVRCDRRLAALYNGKTLGERSG